MYIPVKLKGIVVIGNLLNCSLSKCEVRRNEFNLKSVVSEVVILLEAGKPKFNIYLVISYTFYPVFFSCFS